MIGGLDGNRMLIGLAVGIIVLIFLVLKTKVQAFLALIVCTVIVGVVGGMPLSNTTLEDGTTLGIVNSITGGFGSTLGSIGIIIGFGVMMGQIFEVTGAAKRMAYTFLKLFGKKREEEALCLTGFLVSIPIFCDSGFRGALTYRKGDFKGYQEVCDRTGSCPGSRTCHHPLPCSAYTRSSGRVRYLRDRCRYIYPADIVLAIPMAIGCVIYAR